MRERSGFVGTCVALTRYTSSARRVPRGLLGREWNTNELKWVEYHVYGDGTYQNKSTLPNFLGVGNGDRFSGEITPGGGKSSLRALGCTLALGMVPNME